MIAYWRRPFSFGLCLVPLCLLLNSLAPSNDASRNAGTVLSAHIVTLEGVAAWQPQAGRWV